MKTPYFATVSHAQLLKAAFDPFFETPISAWEGFASVCTLKHYKRNTVLKKEHEPEKYMHFMISGSVGVFLWKENNFVCLDIGVEGSFFCDMMSMISHQATPLQLMLLEDSKVLRLTKEDYLELCETEVGSVISKVAAESSFLHKQQQQIDLLTKSAEERYFDLLKSFPQILNRVSQKHIASYLGITPQSFSRLKKKSQS